MFAYCLNNPINLSDDEGNSSTIAANPNAMCLQSSEGGGGGSIVLLLPYAVKAISSVIKTTLAASYSVITYYATSTGVLAQSGTAPQLADQNPPDGQYQYWEAFWIEKKVYVGKGLSIWEAALRVAFGQNVMCANQDAARWLIKVNHYRNAVGPEVGRGDGFFWHYHPHRETHVHIWFYGGVHP